jgi:hypothetical protein
MEKSENAGGVVGMTEAQDRLKRRASLPVWPYDYDYPIWCCGCGHFHRFTNTFGETCFNCGADHTLDWWTLIANEEIRKEWCEYVLTGDE